MSRDFLLLSIVFLSIGLVLGVIYSRHLTPHDCCEVDVYAGAYPSLKIVGGDPEYDHFGYAVAVDNDTLVVGAYGAVTHASNAGHAYIYRKEGDSWVYEAKLWPFNGNIAAFFGYAVAIDGDTVVIGAYNDHNAEGISVGAAYIFRRNDNGLWHEEARVYAPDGQKDDQFGWSVAVDGDTVVVGASMEDTGGSEAGAAYIFTREDGRWSRGTKIQASDKYSGDYFGHSVSVEDSTLAVGAMLKGDEVGAVYLFENDSGVWRQKQKIQADDRSVDMWFGGVVSLRGDFLIVSAEHEDTGGQHAGAAYIFKRNGDVWEQEAKIQADDKREYTFFGESVSVSDGIAVVGAHGEDAGFENAGAAYVFKRRGFGSWVQIAKIQAPDRRQHGLFGNSVAVWGDTIMVGSYYADAVYNFDVHDL